MEPIEIRAATLDDVPALAALAARTWADAFADSLADAADATAEVEEGRSPARFARTLRDPRSVILVAVDPGGTLIGYAESGPVDIPEAAARAEDRQLSRLYVDTARQGEGIGRRLLGAALARPPLAQAPRVFLQVWERNPRAVALYVSAGFVVVATTTFTVGDSAPMEDLVMVRPRDVS